MYRSTQRQKMQPGIFSYRKCFRIAPPQFAVCCCRSCPWRKFTPETNIDISSKPITVKRIYEARYSIMILSFKKCTNNKTHYYHLKKNMQLLQCRHIPDFKKQVSQVHANFY